MLKKNLLIILEEKNISISQLARETQVPKSTISSWLKGRNPNVEQLAKVAAYLEMTVDNLIFGRKTKDASPILVYRGEIESGSFEIIIRKIK